MTAHLWHTVSLTIFSTFNNKVFQILAPQILARIPTQRYAGMIIYPTDSPHLHPVRSTSWHFLYVTESYVNHICIQDAICSMCLGYFFPLVLPDTPSLPPSSFAWEMILWHQRECLNNKSNCQVKQKNGGI